MAADGKRIGGISVGLALNSDKFSKGLASARRQMTAFQSTMNKSIGGVKSFGAALVGAASVGAMASFTKQGIEQISALSDLSTKLGISTEKLAGFTIAAEDSGVSSGMFEKSILRMTKGIRDANLGVGSAAETYKRLGVDVKALSVLAPDQQFLAIMDAANQLTGQNEKLNVTMDVFGTKSSDMVRLLSEGRAGMMKFQEQARLTGQSIKDDLAKQVEGAGDQLVKFERTLNSFKLKAAIGVTPAINFADEALTGMMNNPGDMTAYAKRVGLNLMNPLGWAMNQGLRGASAAGRPGFSPKTGIESPLSTKGLFKNSGDGAALPFVKKTEQVLAEEAALVFIGQIQAIAGGLKPHLSGLGGLAGKRVGGMALGDLANKASSWRWMLGQQAMSGVGSMVGKLGGPMDARSTLAQRPALSFAESGSVESYRQQAAIRSQRDSMKLDKDRNGLLKEILGAVKNPAMPVARLT